MHLIFQPTVHRPWPIPASKCMMYQRWHDLLFAHWPVDAKVLLPFIPPPLRLDTFENQAWIGVVPFWMSGIRGRGFPVLPYVSRFAEINVRTYVTDGKKAGVWFLSLDAANLLAVKVARKYFCLPYYHARMKSQWQEDRMEYISHRIHPNAPSAEFDGDYQPIDTAENAAPGSLEYWLTERYCLYTNDRAGRVCRAEIHHAPWQLQRAKAEIRMNTMTEAAGISLPQTAPLLHFSKFQEVAVWPLRKL